VPVYDAVADFEEWERQLKGFAGREPRGFVADEVDLGVC